MYALFLLFAMFLLHHRSPGLLLSWQLLWLLAQASPIQELAGKPVGLNPKLWKLTKLWSDLPPKSPQGAALSTDLEDFDYLGSSAPFQMITQPQWTDNGDLLLEPDQFPLPHQGLHDKVTHPERLPEILLRLNNIKNQASDLPSEPPKQVQPSQIHLTTWTQTPPTPELVQSSSPQQEAPSQLPQLLDEAESPAQQEAPARHDPAAEELAQSTFREVQGSLRKSEAQHSSSPPATVNPVDVEVTRTSEAGKEAQPPPSQQQAPLQYPKSPEEVEPPSTLQGPPPQPSEPSVEEESAPTQQVVPPELPEPPPAHDGTAVPTPGRDQAHTVTSPSVTSQPLDLELTRSSQPPKEATLSMALRDTASTAVHPGATPPDQVQDQHLNLPKVTLRPFDLELSITEGSNMGAELSPTPQETLTEPPQTHRRLIAQLGEEVDSEAKSQLEAAALAEGKPPFEQQAPVQTAESPVERQNEDYNILSAIVRLVKVALRRWLSEIATKGQCSPAQQATPGQPPEPPKETVAAHSKAPKPAAPLPKPSEVTSTGQGQTQGPNPAEITAPPLDMAARAQYSGSFQTVVKDQIVPTDINICELCTCQHEMLSCVGLSTEQKLHQVPVPQPDSYNGTFTILNFQGNKIFDIDKSVWKEYPWTENLILRENHLTELHKYTFEGLLTLEYLDVSCNRIHHIERWTFNSLPFLKHINLSCNVMTKVTFGTFQAWHGMQFLNSIILNHNPLMVVEDPYFFKLPALKYLDMDRTHVQLKTAENILLMSLKLETLILPSHLTCCFCQFKSILKVIYKIVHLHCENECLTNTKGCLETSTDNQERAFMKALQDRNETNRTLLTIQPDRIGKEVPGHHYKIKFICAISMTALVTLLILIACINEIYSHRAARTSSGEFSKDSPKHQ